MHTCPPPKDALAGWLNPVAHQSATYGHLLLEQHPGVFNPGVLTALRSYFESAHRDARDAFHTDVGIDLHPDAGPVGGHAQYPRCLPSTARRGLFGEVAAGLITQSYDMVGSEDWSIPIFLFRFHADVEAYMFDLARDPGREREVFGRFGNDFIAIALDSAKNITRFMAGEAKWRQVITQGVMDTLMLGEWTGPEDKRVRTGKGIWYELNRGLAAPRGLRQLQRLLQLRAPDDYAATILSIDKALLLQNPQPLPRTDLIFIAGNRGATRKVGQALLPLDAPPPHYTAGRHLQIVEMVLRDGAKLIDDIYDSLWSTSHAAT
jgi:hypothetical protein